MAKRRDTGPKKKRFGPEAIEETFSSGVSYTFTPLEIEIIRMLEVSLDDNFPLPPQPTEDIAIMGDAEKHGTETIQIGAGDPEHDKWLEECSEIEKERAAFQLDFLIENCLIIVGAESEEGKQALVDAFAPRRAIGESLGQVYEGESDWDITLRFFIIASHEDYRDLMLAARLLQYTAVDQGEMLSRIKSFRS